MKTTHFWYVASGLVMVSLFLLTPPWTTEKLVLGVVPLVFLLSVLIVVWRARKQAKKRDQDDELSE
jgi:cytochrome c-type biogenesis protein CcmH/NrfF